MMSKQSGEIILYQPDNSVKIEVRMENDTVWLNRQQIATLFDRDVKTIGKHINNALQEELSGIATIANFATVQKEGNREVLRKIDYYNLDVILSVGYRVKSKRGVQFRQWANAALKDYLLKGYAINQRIDRMEKKVAEHDEKIDFFVKTALPPLQGIFFDGQIFDAFSFVTNLVKTAKASITLIDNYIDESVLTMMSSKGKGVEVKIYTKTVSKALQLVADKFNGQYGGLALRSFSFSHDRFLIIDDAEMYLIGASLKDLGKKWFAFSKLDAKLIPEFLKRLHKPS